MIFLQLKIRVQSLYLRINLLFLVMQHRQKFGNKHKAFRHMELHSNITKCITKFIKLIFSINLKRVDIALNTSIYFSQVLT
jgi:hypothetical protein